MVTGQDLGADASPLPPGALCWVSSVQHFGHLVWEMELLPSFECYWAASNIDAGAEDFHKDFLRSSVELYVWPYVWQQCSNQTDCMELNSELAAATGGQLQRAVSANSEIFPVCSSSQKSQRCFQLWDHRGVENKIEGVTACSWKPRGTHTWSCCVQCWSSCLVKCRDWSFRQCGRGLLRRVRGWSSLAGRYSKGWNTSEHFSPWMRRLKGRWRSVKAVDDVNVQQLTELCSTAAQRQLLQSVGGWFKTDAWCSEFLELGPVGNCESSLYQSIKKGLNKFLYGEP